MSIEKIKLPLSGARASVKPDSYNEQANTVDIVIATETEVVRRDWDGNKFIEILKCSPDAIRAERLINGNVSFIESHDDWSTDGVYGRVISHRFESGTLIGTVLLATREEVAGKVKDIRSGVLKNCSVGYDVHGYEASERDGVPVITVTDWEPLEISICAINKDRNSVVRSEGAKPQFTEITVSHRDNRAETNEINNSTTNLQTSNMPDTKPKAPETTPAPEASAPVVEAQKPNVPVADSRADVQAERNRAAEITRRVRAAGLGNELAEKLINDGVSLERAYTTIMDEYAKPKEGEADTQTRATSTASVGADREVAGRREAMTDALVLRAMPDAAKTEKLSDERVRSAQAYRTMSMFELARMSAERAQVNVRDCDKQELVKRAITSSTSDFPVLLDGTARRVLLANYNAVADTWRRFCRVGSVSDFREWKRLRMGTLGNLNIVPESGEYKTKKINDADYEKIAVQTWGDIINVTRHMIINDDLGGFANLAAMRGRAAARTIESRVYSLFALNGGNGPTMADGNPLFHASHGNIATTAAAPSVTSFDAARQQMAAQMDKDGNDFLDITPSIWLGPMSLGGEARVINDAQYDVGVSNKFQVPNRVRGMFKDIIDTQRLSGTAWYALAAVADEPVFEVAFLDGQQTPYMETEQGFDVDGMRWKTRLDFDADAIGWKGALKNAGA